MRQRVPELLFQRRQVRLPCRQRLLRRLQLAFELQARFLLRREHAARPLALLLEDPQLVLQLRRARLKDRPPFRCHRQPPFEVAGALVEAFSFRCRCRCSLAVLLELLRYLGKLALAGLERDFCLDELRLRLIVVRPRHRQ